MKLISDSSFYWYFKRKFRKSNISTHGFSQYGQDLFVRKLLEDENKGFFLDIGANDGISLSNTYFFEKLGWNGICVEPNPELFNKLEQSRLCHCINACITSDDGIVKFIQISGPANMLSKIVNQKDPHSFDRIEKEISQKGGNKKIIDIDSISPSTLFKRFEISNVDFLSIDTEGNELQILKAIDYSNISIKVISVENGTRSSTIFRFLTSKGFKLVTCIGCDEVYIRK